MKEAIDPYDFKTIKQENEQKIAQLEARLMDLSQTTTNIESMLTEAVQFLTRLDQFYQEGDVKRKRQIIGSIYL